MRSRLSISLLSSLVLLSSLAISHSATVNNHGVMEYQKQLFVASQSGFLVLLALLPTNSQVKAATIDQLKSRTYDYDNGNTNGAGSGLVAETDGDDTDGNIKRDNNDRRATAVNPLWTKLTKDAVHAGHGTFMAFAFVVLFPLGAMSQYFTFLGRHKLHFHVGCQLFGYALVLIGSTLGIWLAVGTQDWFYDPHTQLGFCMIGLVTLQPLIGVWHHINFRRTGGRTWRSHLHIWFGRILILMGVINGGLGLRLAANASNSELVSYIVLVVVAVVIYGTVVVVNLFRGKSL